MPLISNPVLPGSHPDPSILRVGEDYYLATSSFEWLPGIQLHHSRDLAHWRLLGHALTRHSQLELRGVPDSAGVWAPALSHDGREFHLTYPVVLERRWPLVTCRNYLVTAPDISGPWSDPIFLNASGWDPSLFHAADGRKWLVSHALDFRSPRAAMAGILLQEYSAQQRRLIGEPQQIIPADLLPDVEGPHLYARGGYFYLMLASGGTGWDHAVSLARSRTLTGPYEVDPRGPILTARDDASLPFSRVGHGSLVETTTGEWFIAHLASRPLMPERRSVLGRETLLSRVSWQEDGWLRAASPDGRAARVLEGPALPEAPFAVPPLRDDFDATTLSPVFNTLREWPNPSWLTLSDRPGHLSLRGRALFNSRFEQSLVARRLQSIHASVQTCVDFEPRAAGEMAGLICIYDTADSAYLHVGWDPQRGRHVELLLLDGGQLESIASAPIDGSGAVHLRATFDAARLDFAFSSDGRHWQTLGRTLDASQLSDEYHDKFGFTGAFVGVCAQDFARQAAWAHFDYFEYREH